MKKPKKAIILLKRSQEKPLGTQGLSANHYLTVAQGWQLASRFMIVSHGPYMASYMRIFQILP